MTDEPLKQLPLKSLHEAAGAKFGAFAGWNMPLFYPLGVMKEHLHCRESAGLFDISHMRLFIAQGERVDAMLARACPVDPVLIELSESKYTFLLNEAAGIIDDLIVSRVSPTRFLIVANASRATIDEKRLRFIADDFGCSLAPLDRVFLALQGPKAAEIAEGAGLDLSGLSFMHMKELSDGVIITRSGYTGEDGFEIALPLDRAEAMATRLRADPRVEWIGLAARDSLRLEAGLCLYGNDMDESVDPLSAGLTWAIPKSVRTRGSFLGSKAFEKISAEGARLKRVGLKSEGRQPVRGGSLLFSQDGAQIGHVTSGGFGPTVNHPVAMGYVPKALATPGTTVLADVRGAKVPLTVHTLPFTPHRYFRGQS
jgi:aminomethyltransferase